MMLLALMMASAPVDQTVINAIAKLNRDVNHAIQPVEDQAHYGVPDKWVALPEDRKGDCEDYALSKLMILEQANFPVVSNTRIDFVLTGQGAAHVVLEVNINGKKLIMDSLVDELVTRKQLEHQYGYRFFDW